MMKQFAFTTLLFSAATIHAQQLQWAHSLVYNDKNGYDLTVSGVAMMTGNAVVVAGNFHGTVDFDPGAGESIVTSAGGADIYMAAFDASGNFLWAKTIGGDMSEQLNAITTSANGYIYLGGEYGYMTDFDPGSGTQQLDFIGSQDAFIACYDSDGNYVYAKGFGGTGVDTVEDISLHADGSLSVGGVFQFIADFDPSENTFNLSAEDSPAVALFFGRYDANGNLVWAHAIQSNFGTMRVASDVQGNTVTSGFFHGTVDFDPGAGEALLTGTSTTTFFAKYNNNGEYVFAHALGGTSIQTQLHKSGDIKTDNDGNIYIAGVFVGTADFDPGAGVANLVAMWESAMFFAKYTNDGEYLWANQIQNYYQRLEMHIDNNAHVLLTGGMGSNADMDPGPDVYELTTNGNVDIFMAKYSTAGEFLSAQNFGSTAGDGFGGGICTDSDGFIYLAGMFSGTTDFDLANDGGELISAGDFSVDEFIARFSPGPVSVEEKNENTLLRIWPNPVGDALTMQSKQPLQTIHIIDISGRTVLTSKTTSQTTVLQVGHLCSGVYSIVVGGVVERMVKE
ncbi:MAG: T9SS type A sorting domain-containing protein [Flavobacteriales bacterium]